MTKKEPTESKGTDNTVPQTKMSNDDFRKMLMKKS